MASFVSASSGSLVTIEFSILEKEKQSEYIKLIVGLNR